MAPDDKGGLSHMLLRYHSMSMEELIEMKNESWYKGAVREIRWAKDDFKEWIADTNTKIKQLKRRNKHGTKSDDI